MAAHICTANIWGLYSKRTAYAWPALAPYGDSVSKRTTKKDKTVRREAFEYAPKKTWIHSSDILFSDF